MAVLSYFGIASFFDGELKQISRGENALSSDRLQEFYYDGTNKFVTAKVKASMKDRSYDIKIYLSDGNVQSSSCTCPRGQFRCHHMAVVLLHTHKTVSSTDTECRWSQKRKKHEEAKSVAELFPSSTDYHAAKRAITQEDLDSYRSDLEAVGFRPITWLLADEPETRQPRPDCFLVESVYRTIHPPQDVFSALSAKLAVDREQILKIEQETRGQRSCPSWLAHRKGRITASNFGPVLKLCLSSRRPSKTLLASLKGGDDLSKVRAVQWGIMHEQTAIDVYAASTSVTVKPSGLWLHSSGLLGGSPDGLVSDDVLIEVKCPYAARNNTLMDMADSGKPFFLKRTAPSSDQLCLNVNDEAGFRYFHQIQGNLHVAGRTACDLVVWTPKETAVMRIERQQDWSTNFDRLLTFYKLHFLPLLFELFQ